MSSLPNRDKMIKMVLILAGILLVVGVLSNLHKKNALSLSEYAEQNPGTGEQGGETETSEENTEENLESVEGNGNEAGENPQGTSVSLIGELLNSGLGGGESMLSRRAVYAEGFYYEPLSDSLRRYITGISASADSDFDSLVYAHILYCSMEGEATPGELICSADAAKDLVEIFYELYRSDYRFTKVGLIEEYDGDLQRAMAENLTFCLAWPEGLQDAENMEPTALRETLQDPAADEPTTSRETLQDPAAGEPTASREASQDPAADEPTVSPETLQNPATAGTSTASRENPQNSAAAGASTASREASQDPAALLPGLSEGLCMVVNPLYNPLITYRPEGEALVTPKESQSYADRSLSFAYKIDGEDLCCKLFLQHGFTWGGNRNDGKAYCSFPLE